jgi:hypothetical protein
MIQMLIHSFGEFASCSNEAGAFLMALAKVFTHPPYPSFLPLSSFRLFFLPVIPLPLLIFAFFITASPDLRSPHPLSTSVSAGARARPLPHGARPAARSTLPVPSSVRPAVRFSGTTGAFTVGARFGSTRNPYFCTKLTDRSGGLLKRCGWKLMLRISIKEFYSFSSGSQSD